MDEETGVWVHAQCSKCNFYIEGYAPRAVLVNEDGAWLLHVHYTMTCPGCGRILNLISIEKPLKKEVL
ncbi:MAG: hypothetical protein QW424_03045 [Candidatus Bathyarchaeia archaeon]